MKKFVLAIFPTLALLAGCADANDSAVPENIVTADPLLTPEEYEGERVDTIEFSKDMDGYSINLSVGVYYVESRNSYRLDVNEDNITVRVGGDTVSSTVFNNPYVGGAPFAGVSDYKGITAEVLEMNSGNLLIVRVPVEAVGEENAQCLSVYYFDSGYVNYIGKRKYGGEFFPLIDGVDSEITVDGDTFTVNECDISGEKRTVTYSVDFENILIKELAETEESEPTPAMPADHIGTADMINYTECMGGYSINLSLLFVDRQDGFRLSPSSGAICVRNGEGETVGSSPLVNPYTDDPLDEYKKITAEVLSLAGRDLFIVRVPAGLGDDAGCLSVYCFDDGGVDILKRENGGDFFPLIDGVDSEITVDGDTFTVSECYRNGEKRAVTYAVDFENALIKELAETEESEPAPAASVNHIHQ